MLKQLLVAAVAMAMIEPGLIMTRNKADCSKLQLAKLVATTEADVQHLHDWRLSKFVIGAMATTTIIEAVALAASSSY